jgi:hypothetical protein
MNVYLNINKLTFYELDYLEISIQRANSSIKNAYNLMVNNYLHGWITYTITLKIMLTPLSN